MFKLQYSLDGKIREGWGNGSKTFGRTVRGPLWHITSSQRGEGGFQMITFDYKGRGFLADDYVIKNIRNFRKFSLNFEQILFHPLDIKRTAVKGVRIGSESISSYELLSGHIMWFFELHSTKKATIWRTRCPGALHGGKVHIKRFKCKASKIALQYVSVDDKVRM